MKRRSFFTSLTKSAAIVALVPHIAFKSKLDLDPGPTTIEVLKENGMGVYVVKRDGKEVKRILYPLLPEQFQEPPT